MNLSEHQRAMRDLLRGRAAADDPYIAAAAASTGLAVTRDTILGWQRFRLDRHCRLTAALLRQRGLYDTIVATLPPLPYIEQLAEALFEVASACGDPLVASVAAFERAMLRDEAAEAVVDWPCEPYAILGALLGGGEVPATASAPHQTTVSNAIPGRFRVTRVYARRTRAVAARG
ncbi:MAG TPA: hypothetical protein VG323_19550 [Thermoanaerobaculia bacterium]|nr:hypothetical protein [Thermoanaerobaculia bacterium]